MYESRKISVNIIWDRFHTTTENWNQSENKLHQKQSIYKYPTKYFV